MDICVIGSYAKALVMTSQRIPLAGETLMGWDYRGTYGGKGSDMAVQAARLGASVSYVGVIGEDQFGEEFIELMKSEGIDVRGVRKTDKKPTGTGFIIKDMNAKNIIVIDSGANSMFNTVDIENIQKIIDESAVVLTQLEIPLETALFAMKKGKDAGKITILNPAPATDLSEVSLSDVTILTPNETEARIAAGMPVDSLATNKQVADELLKTGCKYVVMTLGEKGSAIFSKNIEIEVPSYLINVVDSNGAGDCFNASLATFLSEGKDIEKSVYMASAVAALCCTKWETVPSYHNREQVDAFIEKEGR
jgi:ribokinase